MATLLLTAVGTALGGPIGGAIGALAGRQIDGAITGGSGSEGPRLKELAVTTSSYGQPIARHHGHVRVAGTIIWATDLAENRERSGGKGKPKTTTFSYSSSFAVALASRPIEGVGRIWADGNLLRGSAGDLKTGGALRIFKGHGDQTLDPLIAANEGAGCPAFRGCAYAVFEDLQLADFGNRVPALTFEVIADDGTLSLAHMIEALVPDASSDLTLVGLSGFTLEGGAVKQALATIDQAYPIALDAGGELLTLNSAVDTANNPILLPEAASAWEDGDFGGPTGRNRQRDADQSDRPQAIRYYDTDRDYQPGLQRAEGRTRSGRSRTIEFPGSLNAVTARGLANSAAQRAGWRRETLSWRLAELDPQLTPGAIVRAPGISGVWRIHGWEWRERGVELELVRLPPSATTAISQVTGADPGQPWSPPDELPFATRLEAFELPWDGRGSSDAPALFAAASVAGSGWSGASLFANQEAELVSIGTTGRARSTVGELTAPLGPSQAMLFNPAATLDVAIVSADMGFAPATLAGIAAGANRLLVGGEIVQFACAEQTSPTGWRLGGLLRGRGGTEFAAMAGHLPGASVVLIDETLIPIDPGQVSNGAGTAISAIGHGDEEPVQASLTNSGSTLRPLAPVHPITCPHGNGGVEFRWTRRARGAWLWLDEVDAPLVEQSELYHVGVGPVGAPLANWTVAEPRLLLSATEKNQLQSDYPGLPVWVRQIGSHAQSNALLLPVLE